MDGEGREGEAHNGGGQWAAQASKWGRAARKPRAGPQSGHSLQLHPFSVRQVWELREHLGRVRGFWAGLPLTMCKDPTVAAEIAQEAAPCWTGTGRGK